MPKFLVKWTEIHSMKIDVEDENDALSGAADFAGRNNTRDSVKDYSCTRVPVDTPTPTRSAAEERAAARERNKGLTPAEMCHRMSAVELDQNIKRGGVAAIHEGKLRDIELKKDNPAQWWKHYPARPTESLNGGE